MLHAFRSATLIVAVAAAASLAQPIPDTLDVGGTLTWQITRADSAQDHSPSMSPDGRWIAFSRGASGTAGIWLVPAEGGAARQLTFPEGLSEDWYADWSPDGKQIAFSSNRGRESHIWTVRVEDGTLTRVTEQPLGVFHRSNQAVWSPDGTQLAYADQVDGNQDIYLHDLRSNVRRRLTRDPAADAWPGWSPDGEEIAFISGRQEDALFVIPTGGGPTRVLPTGLTDLSNPKWSPDGRWISFRAAGSAAANDTWRNWLLRTSDGTLHAVTPGDSTQSWMSSWSPDGTRLIYTRGVISIRTQMVVVPVSGGEERVLGDSARAWGPDSPVWTPDSREVAYAHQDGGIVVVDAISTRRRILVVGGPHTARTPAWSPDGDWVAFSWDRLGSSDLWITPADRFEPEPITMGSANDLLPVWSPDGGWIAFARHPAAGGSDSQWDLWRVPLTRDPPEHVLDDGGIDAPVLWPSAGQILYARSNPAVTFWRLGSYNLASGTRHTVLDSLDWLGVSADGRFVVHGQAEILVHDLTNGSDHLVATGGLHPAISPDGKLVAFFRRNGASNHSIWAADVRHIVERLPD